MPETRYQVARLWVMHKGKYYATGEFLPEAFTERDRQRNIYTRRIIEVTMPDSPPDLPVMIQAEVPKIEAAKPAVPIRTGTGATKKPTQHKTIT